MDRELDRRARRLKACTDPRLASEEPGEPREIQRKAAGRDDLHARRGCPRGIEQGAGRPAFRFGVFEAPAEVGDAGHGFGRAHARPHAPRRRVPCDRDDGSERGAAERGDRAVPKCRVPTHQRGGGESGHPRAGIARERAGRVAAHQDARAVHAAAPRRPGRGCAIG